MDNKKLHSMGGFRGGARERHCSELKSKWPPFFLGEPQKALVIMTLHSHHVAGELTMETNIIMLVAFKWNLKVYEDLIHESECDMEAAEVRNYTGAVSKC